jgi:hypothetical protein
MAQARTADCLEDWFLVELGSWYVQRGEIAKALTLMTYVPAESAWYGDACLTTALGQELLGNWGPAAQIFQRVLAADPRNECASRGLERCHRALKPKRRLGVF